MEPRGACGFVASCSTNGGRHRGSCAQGGNRERTRHCIVTFVSTGCSSATPAALTPPLMLLGALCVCVSVSVSASVSVSVSVCGEVIAKSRGSDDSRFAEPPGNHTATLELVDRGHAQTPDLTGDEPCVGHPKDWPTLLRGPPDAFGPSWPLAVMFAARSPARCGSAGSGIQERRHSRCASSGASQCGRSAVAAEVRDAVELGQLPRNRVCGGGVVRGAGGHFRRLQRHVQTCEHVAMVVRLLRPALGWGHDGRAAQLVDGIATRLQRGPCASSD